MAEEEERLRIKTYPCDVCGRNFKQESLIKHRSICKKQANKTRKVFDSGRQRALGSDVNYAKTRETMRVITEGKPAGSPPKTHWREKHNEFIKSVRQARMITEAEAKGAPLPKFEHSAVPSDYVNCPHCARNFNQSAAQRHIPFCETQSKRQKINTSANQRSNTRPQAVNGTNSGRFQANQMPPQRKISAESATTSYSSASSASRGGYGLNSGGGGQLERRPIKYDSQTYYDNQLSPDQGAYSSKNKSLLAQKAAQRNVGDQLLRTGRNLSNNELNNVARNRSGNSLKDATINSRERDTSINRRQVIAQSSGAKNAQLYRGGGNTNQQQHRDSRGSSKYCLECGTEFPVAWAKFCSHCGYTRS